MGARMIESLNRASDWSKVRAVVAGIGVAGFACADALAQLGAEVVLIDANDTPAMRERAEILDVIGVDVRLGFTAELPECDVLVVSPGLPPSHATIEQAFARGVPVWGELELAWRLRPIESPAPWLVITGTNGKTTTTLMLESILRAAGLRTCSAGNIGMSLVGVVMHDELDVIAIEVGAPQLPFVTTMSPFASCCLNIADDHIDHFGSLDTYIAAKARIYERTEVAAVYNAEDERTRSMVERADVIEGCRAIGFTLGAPGLSMLGIVENLLVDRAFVSDRATTAQELATIDDINPPAPHNVANALAAAALARAFGVSPAAVRDGLRAFVPAAHRIAQVATVDGVVFVDDSKATNAHAALTSLKAYPSVVWIAGGMAKGQDFDDLVIEVGERLRGVVLLGVDRARIIGSLERHAPEVRTRMIDTDDSSAMAEAVAAAMSLAESGDTVLLAPGCASWDMFRDYGHRGDEFAAAVERLAVDRPKGGAS
jgi:UDP-N-acetylmuramoylalanine--D-glutamate ligase